MNVTSGAPGSRVLATRFTVEPETLATVAAPSGCGVKSVALRPVGQTPEDDIVAVNDAPELTVIAAVVGAAGAFASPTRA